MRAPTTTRLRRLAAAAALLLCATGAPAAADEREDTSTSFRGTAQVRTWAAACRAGADAARSSGVFELITAVDTGADGAVMGMPDEAWANVTWSRTVVATGSPQRFTATFGFMEVSRRAVRTSGRAGTYADVHLKVTRQSGLTLAGDVVELSTGTFSAILTTEGTAEAGQVMTLT